MVRKVNSRVSGFVGPCQPSRVARPPSGAFWVHEIKHDGYRLMVHREGSRIRCFTRNGHEWGDRFPAIVLAARRLKAESFVIDGEVVVLRGDGRSDFNALRGKHRNDDAVLLAFDLVECKGKDLRDVPLIDRKRKLLRLLGKTMTGIQFLDHFPDDGESVFRHACLMGLEGIVSKRIDAPYRSGPSTIRWERQCDARPRTIGTRDIESALLALVKLNAESSPNATFGHHRAARR